MPKRNKPISVYLNEDEKKVVEDAAKVEGLSLASYIRRVVLQNIHAMRADDKSTKTK